jgi:hypothetical protein
MKVEAVVPNSPFEEPAKRLEVSPTFITSSSAVPVLYLRVLDKNGEVIEQAAVAISGVTGKLRLLRLEKPVTPSYYRPPAEPAEPAATDGETEAPPEGRRRRAAAEASA